MRNFPINFLSLAKLASNSGRVVKHKTHDPEIEGSNPADGTRRDPLELVIKWQKTLDNIVTPSFHCYRQGVLFMRNFPIIFLSLATGPSGVHATKPFYAVIYPRLA